MVLYLPRRTNLTNINCFRLYANQPKKKLQFDSGPSTAGGRHQPHELLCRMRKQMYGGEVPQENLLYKSLRWSTQIVSDSSGRDCCREVRGHQEELLF